MRFAFKLLTFIALFISTYSHGQESSDCDPKLLRYNDGQNLGFAWGMCQDTTGVLWMAGGLWPMRSDNGKTVEVYKKAELSRLGSTLTPLSQTMDVALNKNKHIIFTCLSKAYEFNPYSRQIIDSFVHPPDPEVSQLWNVIGDKADNSIWAVSFDYTIAWDAWLLRGSQNHELEKVFKFEVNSTPNLIEYRNKIFVTGAGVIHAVDKQSYAVKEYSLFDSNKRIVLGNFSIDKNNRLWVKSSSFDDTQSASFFAYDTTLDSFVIALESKQSVFKEMESIAINGDDLWVAGGNGHIGKINLETDEWKIYDNELRGKFEDRFRVFDVFLDAESQPYVLTDSGIGHMRKKNKNPFGVYLDHKGENCVKDCWIQSVASSGEKIYCAFKSSLYAIDNETGTVQRLPIKLPDQINGFAPYIPEDFGAHKLLFFNDKLIWHDNIIDLKTYKIDDLLTYGGDYRCVNYVSSDNILWLAPFYERNKDRRVMRYDLTNLEFLETQTNDTFVIGQSPIQFLESRYNNIMWLCYNNGGVVEYTKKGEFIRRLPLGGAIDIHNIGVNCLLETEPDYLWIGNSDGLAKVDLKTLELKRYSDGRVNEIGQPEPRHIRSFVSVNDSILWLPTLYGMERFNLNTEKFVTPILPVEITSRGYGTGINYFDTTENKLYLSSLDGVISFKPSDYQQMSPVESKFPLLITELVTHTKLDSGNVYDYSNLGSISTITLPHHHFWFSIRYVLPYMMASDDIYYSHKLEGFENDFTYNRDFNTIKYTNLPPGEYDLILRAGLREQTLDEYTKTIRIVVLQAWYKKWWMKIIWFLLLAGLIYFVLRQKFREEIKRREAIEALRTKISMDLHDDVGSLLSGLAMQVELLGLKVGDVHKDRIEKISTISRTAMMQLRDTVWAMDNRKNNWLALVNRINEFGHMSFQDRDIDFDFNQTVDQQGAINPVIRQNIYLILKEALTNIVKHSDATKVNVSLSSDDSNVILSIIDNGSASSMESAGQGLSNMRTRAEEIKAKLNINSERGYKIQLLIPVL